MQMRVKLSFIIVAVLAVCASAGLAGSPARRNSSSLRKHPQQSKGNTTSIVGQTSTLLPNGRILLTGGEGADGPLSGIAVRNPQTGETQQVLGHLTQPRAGHSATLLPDGTVFIFGGVGSNGKLIETAETFDLVAQRTAVVGGLQLESRAHHTATLLTDGSVLIAGGVGRDGELISSLQIVDPLAKSNRLLDVQMLAPRRGHTATLNADGTVLFWGGVGRNNSTIDFGEVFDSVRVNERVETNISSLKPNVPGPFVEASSPTNGAENVALTVRIAVRFSEFLNVRSVNTSSFVLIGPDGNAVSSKIIPAEFGMLAFVTPAVPLNSGTAYTLRMSGAADNEALTMQDTEITFTTTVDAVSGVVAGSGQDNGAKDSGKLDDKFHRLPPLKAHPGVTALSGQVLKLNATPLAHTLLQIDDQKTFSDETGRFLLENVTPGHHVMVIDGSAANAAGIEYGIYDDGVDIKAGDTNVLNYKIWMTALDRANAVTISSPTSGDVVVTTPKLPGLELHLPANTVIRDRNGNVVTQLTITAIPVNQPPFPLPKGVEVPTYFTIQPGGAYLDLPAGSWGKGATLWYPNWQKAKPGVQFDFWNYDPEGKGWYVYGEGSVSKDSKSVIPDPGVEIYQFTGAMFGSAMPAPAWGNPAANRFWAGDPVSLSTGLFVYNKTDLVLPDVIPLTVERTYRPNDNQSRPFGIGTTDNYEVFLQGDTNPYTFVELILPDGSRIHFDRTSPGTGFADAVYMHTATPSSWYGATILPNAQGYPGAYWVLTTTRGTKYYFPEANGQTNAGKMALLGFSDRFGNTVSITRDNNGNVTKVTSPNSRYITFQNDTSNRITQAQDNAGRTVLYQYDAVGRLQQVNDAGGGVWLYTYDSNNNMLTIKDARQIVYQTNYYDSNNRVYKQVQVDGSTYLYNWTLSASGAQGPYWESGGVSAGGSTAAVEIWRACTTCNEGYNPLVTQVDVTDPNGNVRRVKFGPTGYTTSDTYALGKPEQQTYTYAYYADNLIQSVTDPLGRVTSYSYDANGNLTSITRLSGTANAVTTTMTYDGLYNLPLTVTDPLNNTTTFTYDVSGALVAITDPLQHQTIFANDPEGRPLSVTDTMGNTVQFSYFAADLSTFTDPLSRTTTRFTDAAGRLLALTDPSGQTTKMAYNALNQLTSTIDPKGNGTTFSYDLNGNLLTLTDANQHTTTYTYDNMDRLSTRKDPLQNQESYQYDANGNSTQFTDRRSKIATFNYDGLNRKTFAGYGTTAGPAYESSVTYRYDTGNRLTQIVDTSSGTITRGYDNLDRLTSDATPQGTVGYGYDAAGRRTSLTVPGQSVVNYSFDSANRVTQITQGSATVQFSYDAANRRTSLTLPNSVVTTYTYDNASQLTGITYASGTNSLGSLSYVYDLAGRRTSVGGSMATVNLPNAVSTTAYNVNNQLTTWGTANLFYDANGNMTSDGTHSYSWDARNRLAAMDSGTTASFGYDTFGRRSSKTILTAQKSFLYDGANAVQELSGATPTANVLAGGVDEVFQRTDSGGAMSLLADALGSTVGLVDTTGILKTTYTYEPFGNITATGTSTTNSTTYTGRELDATGLYFYRARYYNATLQRFISEDPTDFLGGINLYAYAGNSPASFRDSLGLNPSPGRRGFSLVPHTFGASVDARAEAGAGPWGGSTAASGGYGVAASRNQVATVFSGGAATNVGDFVAGSPSQDSKTTGTIGAYAGVGQSFFISNGEPSDLQGPFKTLNVNIGLVGFSLGGTFSFGDNGVYQISVTNPFDSPGVGAAVSAYTTNTIVCQAECH